MYDVLWKGSHDEFFNSSVELSPGILENNFELEQEQFGVVYSFSLSKEDLLSLSKKIKELFPDG